MGYLGSNNVYTIVHPQKFTVNFVKKISVKVKKKEIFHFFSKMEQLIRYPLKFEDTTFFPTPLNYFII